MIPKILDKLGWGGKKKDAGEVVSRQADKKEDSKDRISTLYSKVGMSHDVFMGDIFGDAISRAIANSRIMVFIFSSHSNNSDFAKSEVLIALQSKAII